MDTIFFDDASALIRTAIVGVLAYAALVVLLRLSGKRTLAKMNAFDFVVTVALGSTLASILVSKEVALAQGVLAFALLIGLQFVISWSSVRAPWIRQAVTGTPLLLAYRGELLRAAMKRARITDDELQSAVRNAGLASLADAGAVVLETDGSFSVLQGDFSRPASALAGVAGVDDNVRR